MYMCLCTCMHVVKSYWPFLSKSPFFLPFKQHKESFREVPPSPFSLCFLQITMNAPLTSTCVGQRAFARTLLEASLVNASGDSHLIQVAQAVKVGRALSLIQLVGPHEVAYKHLHRHPLWDIRTQHRGDSQLKMEMFSLVCTSPMS